MAVQRMRLCRLKRLLGLPRFEEHLELHRVDCVASHGKLDNYDFLRSKLEELGREQIAPPPLATGHDLIAMGYEAGPRFREILDALREEQLDERITTAEQALAWIRQRFPKT